MNKKNSIAVPGLKPSIGEETSFVQKDEGGNVIIPPHELFVKPVPEGLDRPSPVPPKPPQMGEDKMMIKIPDYRPYLNSGRLVCQPFTRKKGRSGDIIFANEANSERIPKNTTCIVVRKDDNVKGIELFDEVVFADEFKPCEKSLPFADTMVTYYVPHYMDVILIKRAGEKIAISPKLMQKIEML
jgi:hypothetical protein